MGCAELQTRSSAGAPGPSNWILLQMVGPVDWWVQVHVSVFNTVLRHSSLEMQNYLLSAVGSVLHGVPHGLRG